MKKFIYSSILIFFLGLNVFGQSQNWSVNENNFQYTMSFVGFVNVSGTNLASANDKVAAFVNGECRGVTNLTYVASEDSYYAYLTVFSNENNEVVNFKIYDSSNDLVKDVEGTKSFEINAHYGNLFQAYSFANPTLSKNAEILEFSFNEVNLNDKSIVGSAINIDVNSSVNIADLNAIFELSPGAKLFIGTDNIVSGDNSIDFSNPIEFQVLSEDQSILKQWVVKVSLSLGTVTYYKKDAVCYAGGALKILYTENNLDAVLTFEGSTYATQTIHDGEAIFNNLGVGTYQVKIGGNVKEITINLKE